LRLRDILSDPVYGSGIDPESVIDMMDDIKSVYFNESKYIRIPKPMDGTAPFETMRFSGSSSIRPEGLSVTSRKVSSNHKSRRALSRSLSVSMDSQIPNRNDKTNIMIDIDEAIEMIGNSRVTHHEDDHVSIKDQSSKETVEEPIPQIVGRPAGRARRRVV